MSEKSRNHEDRYRRKQQRERSHQSKLPGEDDEPLPPPAETIHADDQPGRNDPCPCGSGKKYKHCCANKG